jgi:hypothetical protein
VELRAFDRGRRLSLADFGHRSSLRSARWPSSIGGRKLS